MMCEELDSGMREVWCPEGDSAIRMTEVEHRIVLILGQCMACPKLCSMLCDDEACGGVLIF